MRRATTGWIGKGFSPRGTRTSSSCPPTAGLRGSSPRGTGASGRAPRGCPSASASIATPDGSEIIFDGLRADDADGRYRESHLYAVNAGTREIRQITGVKGPWQNPIVSYDGKLIAFTGFEWTPQSYRAEDLHVIGRDGTGMRRLSGDLDRDPRNLRWAPHDSGIYFTAGDRGTSNVWFAGVAGGARPVTEAIHLLSLASLARDGTAAGVRAAPQEPGDVVTFKLDAPREPSTV